MICLGNQAAVHTWYEALQMETARYVATPIPPSSITEGRNQSWTSTGLSDNCFYCFFFKCFSCFSSISPIFLIDNSSLSGASPVILVYLSNLSGVSLLWSGWSLYIWRFSPVSLLLPCVYCISCDIVSLSYQYDLSISVSYVSLLFLCVYFSYNLLYLSWYT